jgi:hypothetical protein
MAAGAAIAAGAAMLPYLKNLPKALKAIYSSKAFLPALAGTAFFGGDILREVGAAGDRGLTREQLALQKLVAEAGQEASKRSLSESRKQTKTYLKELAKAKREEAKEARESALMQSFINSQDRQLAIALQALQGVSQSVPTLGTTPTQTNFARTGMVNMMRSAL